MKILIALGFLLLTMPANATTFCHVETGKTMDCQLNNTSTEYLARYFSGVTKSWTIVQTDDTVQNYAAVTVNGDGSYSYQNPAPPTVMATPIPLSEADFIQLVQTAGGMTDAQLVACRSDANFAAMWIKFQAAPLINRNDPRVQAGLAGLEQAEYINKGGAATINAAWPNQ